jgi:lipoprotein signal peptidase
MKGIARGISGVFATIWRAIRARPLVFAGVALAVVALDIFLPVIVLSVFRKPYDYFTFNPWLKHAPAWALSPTVTLARKIEFLSNVAIFWFIANSPYDEPAWGFSAGIPDIVRWLYMGTVFGAYFALWFYARARRTAGRWAAAGGGRGGAASAMLSTLGLFTSPCGVTGCGAPILPVLALALQGLTSGTLTLLATISHIASVVVLYGATLAVLVLAWLISRAETAGPAASRTVDRGHTGTAPA